ncbi:TonB-dependent receptor [Asticcacaulis machinosus]|uniref:TonB-dependent receptor n=1 Tax=Asticcacaulis machinosus TaxID=2984211 RepID=A0ABT5HH55_9CAUL|nr:TonB-dependent receptor [Asticcacaulis machinosus]MDC7675584.1 TonB-dependent receptor [Asticcacaulis machinosus]
MSTLKKVVIRRKSRLLATSAVMGLAMVCGSVQAQESDAGSSEEIETVVVQGFRASLQSAMNIKKRNDGIVDAIVAEDMAKFPDANLAESIQRIPGVTLTRSDGGEGRNITVRGLNAGFTRVRINGIEGTTATGASDILGSTNRSRAFDFSVFASDLFNAIEVRKTSSADVEEGSLGATVDLKTGKAFDNPGFHYAISAQSLNNELEGGNHPRVAGIISNTWGQFGVLGSVAWSKRSLLEEGYEAVDILAASQDGGFCSPVGYAPQNPANNATKGTDAANCATGIPRTSSLADYTDVMGRTDSWAGTNVAGSGAFHPRLPRYRRSLTDYERMGATLALQWRPSDATRLDLDLMYGKFENTRHDNYILALSNGRNAGAGGKPYSSIVEAEFADDGSWVYGKLNGVDIRSEGLRDVYTTTYKQITLTGSHVFNEKFRINGLIGLNNSLLDEPIRTTIQIDIPNVNGFSWDFRENEDIPLLTFGTDVANPNLYLFNSGTEPDGTVHGAWNGRFLTTESNLKTYELNSIYDVNDNFSFHAGASFRQNDWHNVEGGPSAQPFPSLPAGTSLASLTRQISGFGKNLDGPSGVLSSWTAIDLDKFLDIYNVHCYCSSVPGAAPAVPPGVRDIAEEVTAIYAMGKFNYSVGSVDLRGDFGIRQVKTEVQSSGIVTAGTTRSYVTVPNEYMDTLPSFNLTAILPNDLYLRFSAAKVLSRPEYVNLAPTSTVNTTVQTVSIGNPELDPIRADTFDLQAEWYFAEGALLSAGLFHKKIDTFIQGFSALLPWNTLGLPDDLLTSGGTCSITGGTPVCPSSPTTLFNVSRSVNTDGGDLSGLEVSYQQPFTFLPGILKNTGLIANWTHVESEIEYITRIDNPTTPANEELKVTGDFTGLSRNAYNLTLYYEDAKFSARISGNHKGRAINNVLGNVAGHDFIFTDPATYVDFSTTYKVTPRLNLTLEGQNITDQGVRFGQDKERNDTRLYVHSGRTITVGFNYKY